MARYSVHEAKTNLSRLIGEALAGDEVVISRGQTPVVRLTPLTPVGRRRFGALKGRIAIDARFDEALPEDETLGWMLD